MEDEELINTSPVNDGGFGISKIKNKYQNSNFKNVLDESDTYSSTFKNKSKFDRNSLFGVDLSRNNYQEDINEHRAQEQSGLTKLAATLPLSLIHI